MLGRFQTPQILRALSEFPVVAILGPRQVGKTTLALELAQRIRKPTTYLDLEIESDRAKLDEAELYLARQTGRLTILDELQRRPELFPLLRGLVDQRIRAGERTGQFLVLGSASVDLLRQSSESLAGRIAYLELRPFALRDVASTGGDFVERLWLRGGFPLSYLAADEGASWRWREQFLSTYLERDIPQLGPRLPAEQMRRFLTMLAHGQGDALNMSKLATNLGLTGVAVRRYVDVLTDLFLVRQLPAWSGNDKKRLAKVPKVYVRDSGLAHRLAGVADAETLFGHPLLGRSWEGFAVEELLAPLTSDWRASYYRTQSGAEIDLVLEGPRGRVLAIEIKRTLMPSASKGFLIGSNDIGATERWFVVPSGETRPLRAGVDVIALAELALRLAP